MIEINVKTLDSKDHHFSVDDNITIKSFKELIASEVAISASEQRLIYCGRVLQDDKPLSEYDVNGKSVHLVQKPPSLSNSSSYSNLGSDNATGSRNSSSSIGVGGNNQTETNQQTGNRTVNNLLLGTINIPQGFFDASHLVLSVSTLGNNSARVAGNNISNNNNNNNQTTRSPEEPRPSVNVQIDLGQIPNLVAGTVGATVAGITSGPNGAPIIQASAPIRVGVATPGGPITITRSLNPLNRSNIGPNQSSTTMPTGGIRNDGWQTHVPNGWIPIIKEDIDRQKVLSRQRPFSDAYNAGNPKKKRKQSDNSRDGQLIKPFSNSLREAIIATKGPLPNEKWEEIENKASTSNLSSQYHQQVYQSINERLASDSDFDGEKFTASRQVFQSNHP
ncbi:large proline-rich protein bag6-B-like [Panonychus citri]|uniref:large proline-rich protein bag6-B-like n=1 Tax=Panonychus citri TaxID=50023 RepID=UPI002307427F|nr:large proline-rich protein bag6-B-like [Panonychus citri]